MDDYSRAIELAVEKERETLGDEQALEAASNVEGLELDTDGNVVSMEGDGKKVLSDLVEEYTEVAGPVSSSLIAYEIRDEMDVERMDLPENVREHL